MDHDEIVVAMALAAQAGGAHALRIAQVTHCIAGAQQCAACAASCRWQRADRDFNASAAAGGLCDRCFASGFEVKGYSCSAVATAAACIEP